MREYYFIRHAIPLNNVGGFDLKGLNKDMVGAQDQSLSEKGKKQASALKDTIQRLNIQCVLSSTMKRAVETAGIISEETGISHENKYKELVEFQPGRYSHNLLTRTLLSASGPTVPFQKRYSKQLYRFYITYYLAQWARDKTVGGESLEEIFQRVDSGLAILDTNPAERIAIVGHGFWIFFMALKILGNPRQNLHKFSWVNNCSITRVDSDGHGNHELRFFAKEL